MNRFTRGAIMLLACFGLAFSGSAARAQSGEGLLNTIKSVVSDPAFGSLLMSKFASPAALSARQGWPTGTSNPGTAALPSSGQADYAGEETFETNPGSFNPEIGRPNAGFYSLEQGARLGGIGYSPTVFPEPDSRLPIPSAASPYLPASPAFSPPASPITFTKHLSPAELRELSRFNISVLIDKSGSMASRDCPNEIAPGRYVSRWEWCREQSANLARQTAQAMPAGITVVPFAADWQRFTNVRPEGINSVFNTALPGGSTNLAGALQSELDRYFRDRDSGYAQHPLMIAVITDGVPDDKSAVRQVIREATEQMRRPDEIKIVFFVIGQDRNGAEFVNELADGQKEPDYSQAGAAEPFNIVYEHSFAEVTHTGLARSLASSAVL
jgi:uncharacterized protein YegL